MSLKHVNAVVVGAGAGGGVFANYGDPRHGGNREQIGYRMVGVPAIPVRGRSKHDVQAPADPGKRS